MSKPLPLGCLVACGLTIVIGLATLTIASIYTNETTAVRDIWIEIYSLSVYSIIVSVLAILFAAALIYVVIQQYPVLTAICSGLLLFVSFLAVICGVVIATTRASLGDTTFNKTEILFQNSTNSDQVFGSKETFMKIQQNFECCGVKRAEDWRSQYPDRRSVPDSCCIHMFIGCGQGSLYDKDKIYHQGCVGPIRDNLDHKYAVLTAMNFTIMGLAIVSATFGIIYERYIREQYEAM